MTEQKPSERKCIHLLLVESQQLVLDGMRAALEAQPDLHVVAEARDGAEAMDGLLKEPDVILLELDLGAHSGMDLMSSLFQGPRRPPVVIVTGSQNRDHHLRALCLGAVGIVLKHQGIEVLVRAIRKVHSGEAWINRTMMVEALAHFQKQEAAPEDPDQPKITSLTPRERAVIALIGEGCRNKEIGNRLFISEKTVRHHLSSVFSKLAVADRLELMIFAYQHGLAHLPARRNAPSKEAVPTFVSDSPSLINVPWSMGQKPMAHARKIGTKVL